MSCLNWVLCAVLVASADSPDVRSTAILAESNVPSAAWVDASPTGARVCSQGRQPLVIVPPDEAAPEGRQKSAELPSLKADQLLDSSRVVVYVALDRGFSEPILQDYQKRTGVNILPVYDTESTKTVGLVNRIRAEKGRPRCDVFWNNEIVNTVRLKTEGLLQPCHPAEAAGYPSEYQDPDGYWYGFAARARVLVVNDQLVPPGVEPKSIFDLTLPQWKGKVGIAKPLFGTTASHLACLFAALGEEKAVKWLDHLKANDVQILSGNRACAQAVGKGELACALTDTDDAMLEIAEGKPVRIVYLDDTPDGLGTLFIPNTLSVVKGAPDAAGAERLINYLLSAEVEAGLAAGPSAQIPLNKNYTGRTHVKTPREVKVMQVDLSAAATQFSTAAKYVEKRFLD